MRTHKDCLLSLFLAMDAPIAMESVIKLSKNTEQQIIKMTKELAEDGLVRITGTNKGSMRIKVLASPEQVLDIGKKSYDTIIW